MTDIVLGRVLNFTYSLNNLTKLIAHLEGQAIANLGRPLQFIYDWFVYSSMLALALMLRCSVIAKNVAKFY